MRELHLFSGVGGGILGGMLLGHTCVCAVEIEPYCRQVLLSRQRDGILPKFPIWDDVRTFDGKPWRGLVDVVCGGFPCQDISAAGKGAGITGERSGLWSEMRRIVGEIRPRFVFVENSPVLTSRGLGTVLGELAALGYDAQWGVVSAADAIWLSGTPCLDHLRERIWIVAFRRDTHVSGLEGRDGTLLRKYARERFTRETDSPSADIARFLQRWKIQRAEWQRTRESGQPDGNPDRSRHERPSSVEEFTDDENGTLAASECRRSRESGEVVATGQENAEHPSDRRGQGRERGSDSSGARERELTFQADADSGQHVEVGRAVRTGRRGTRESETDRAGEKGTHWWQSESGLDRVAHGISHRVDRLKAIGNAQMATVVRLAWEILGEA